MATTKELVRTTCPRDCYDACGIVVVKRDGKITKVLGDPEHPVSRGVLCGKCALAYNGVWQDARQRLLRPLKRAGQKGEGKFVPIEWPEAQEQIAGRLREIVAARGGASVLHTHYTGTCSLIAGNFPLRFFNRLGATEVDPDTVCNKAGHEALKLVFGTSFFGFDPRSAKNANCVMIWGANPSASAPHAHRHWIPEAKKNASLIVVDPIRHETAKSADIHLRPFPGADAALAFGILHVLWSEKRLNMNFIGRHVVGFEELVASEMIQKCTPAWTERNTGVSAELVKRAAQAYSEGPALLWLGQGLQRQPRGGNVMRAISLLPALTGNMGKPGAGVLYMNAFPARGIDMDYLNGTSLRSAAPAGISHMDLADVLNDSERSSALFTWNNNIAASSPNQLLLRQGLRREDLFHVALDPFHTDTVDFADFVLPAASFLEFDDLVLSYFDYSTSAQSQVAEPMGQSVSNQEIFRRLARSMGFLEPDLYEPDEMILETLLKQTGFAGTFSDLKSRGTVYWQAEPVVRFQDGRYPTGSGKIEIASEAFVAAGLPRLPEPHADPRPKGGMLRLLSPASEWLMNSSYANDAQIDKRLGPASVRIHPEEARRRYIGQGTAVNLLNATGRLQVIAVLDESVPEGVALLPKGRWPRREPGSANVNFLNPGAKTDLAESSSVHSIEVELVPAEAAAKTEALLSVSNGG